MATSEEYTKYAGLAQIQTTDVQNPQDLAAMWGEIENQCEELGVEIEQSYAVIGQFDFLFILDAPSRDLVLKSALLMERHGLDIQTLGVVPTDQFSEIVADM